MKYILIIRIKAMKLGKLWSHKLPLKWNCMTQTKMQKKRMKFKKIKARLIF